MGSLEIINLLEKKIKHDGLRLPSYVVFSIRNKMLSIVLGKHNSNKSVNYSCCANMQSDEAAFEGWAICIKHHLRESIDSVELNWESPLKMSANEELHYNRFLYRVIHFKGMFDWFYYNCSKSSEVASFAKKLNALYINTPLTKATTPSVKSSKEKQIEYNPVNLDCLKHKFKFQNINHQLPVGVKKNNARFFTGGASGIDIWGIDDNNNLNIFELKYKNSKVGIISEILFYSEVMYEVFVSKSINIPSKIKLVRDAEYLYGNKSIVINTIKSHFLFDALHPMIIGTTALLNSNNLGITFFNVQYKLKPKTLLFDFVYYKGALQMTEEKRQSFFRNNVKLIGNKYILRNGDENLYQGIVDNAKQYFKENNISWWKYGAYSDKEPTNHMLSSQIQCLNFLFAIRKDKGAMLELAQLFDSEIDDVCPTLNDYDPGFIAFEFTYKNEELLGETDYGAKRGKMCTSVDAFIIAKKKKKKILIPVEWKYTEAYFDCVNKALENSKGKTRQSRYNPLILSSGQLKSLTDLQNTAYYYEPFYEFMRQTLLVEQMIKRELADDFLHVVIISEKNEDLLGSSYKFSPDNLETIWRNCLTDQTKFKLVQNSKLLSIFEKHAEYNALFNYLNHRYF